jgi:hypothetical protein
MKTRLIITGIIFCGCAYFLKAQDTIKRDMIYKTTVRILSDPSFTCYGALYEVKDSSISISSRRIKDYNSGNVEFLIFPVNSLKVIHTTKPGNGKTGAWIGAVSGFAAGALFGLATANNTMLGIGGNMAFCASCGLLIGTPTGFIAGKIAGNKRTPINGSMDKYNLYKDRLKDYAIKK